MSFSSLVVLFSILAAECQSKAVKPSIGSVGPHFAVNVNSRDPLPQPIPAISLPVCHEIDGEEGEFFTLFEEGTSNSKVDAHFIQSPRMNQQETFFGMIMFQSGETLVIISPEKIAFTSSRNKSQVSAAPWNEQVPQTQPMIFKDTHSSLIVKHIEPNVIQVFCGKSEYKVERNLLTYGENKNEFRHLGVYLTPTEGLIYGGAIGDLIDKETGPMTSSFELVYIYIGDKTSSLPEELTETAENTEVELRWLTGRSLISPFQCDK